MAMLTENIERSFPMCGCHIVFLELVSNATRAHNSYITKYTLLLYLIYTIGLLLLCHLFLCVVFNANYMYML